MVEVNSIEEAEELAAMLARHKVPAVPYDEAGREYCLRPDGKLAPGSAVRAAPAPSSASVFDLPWQTRR